MKHVTQRLLRITAIASAVLSCTAPLAAQPAEGTLENLGGNVNSESKELCPIIAPDGKKLYFQRQVPARRLGQEKDYDIYVSTQLTNGTWSQAQPLPEPLNTWDWNGLNSILPDGNTLFLDYRYDDDGSTSRGFSISKRTTHGWGKPVAVQIDGYQNLNDHVSAYLSNDGKTLLLAIEDEDSRGDLDLYVSFMESNGTFSKPMNLGDVVNTPGGEACPFLAADGATLYFASDGHGGYGNYDIVMTRRLDDSWTKWSPPVNMGEPINTTDFDAYYTISASGDYAYLVSYANSLGSADLFRVKLSQSMKPRPVVLIAGRAFDAKTKRSIEARIRYEMLPDGRDAGTAQSTPIEGYKITLPAGGRYGVRAEAGGYYPINTDINLANVEEYEERSVDLFLMPIEVGSTIRLNNIFFETGSATLMPESFPELKRVVTLMTESPTLRISVTGHTDNVGKEQDNMTLSINRAKSVVDYLTSQGLDADRLAWAGFGESRPEVSNDTEEGRSNNRRVEFTVTAK